MGCGYSEVIEKVPQKVEKPIPEVVIRKVPKIEPGDGTARILTHLVSIGQTIYPRDFFWWHYKKQMLGIYGRVADIDRHVIQVGEKPLRDIETFLGELVQKSQNEAEIFRAIFRWVAANIAYENNETEKKANNTNNSPGQTAVSILERRYANCQGFSFLLKYLLNEVGIGSEVVQGAARGSSFSPGCDVRTMTSPHAATNHCWNRVNVNGSWFLCDPTWASELVVTEDGIQRKPAGFREVWFMTDPEIFISTHMPLKYHKGSYVADIDEQILYKSVKDLEEWNSRAWVSGFGEEWGIKPISHPRSVIDTHKKQIQITFTCPHIMTLTPTLVNVDTSESLYGYVMLYTTGGSSDVVKVDIRLPKNGRSFLLRIQAMPQFEEDPIAPYKNDADVVLTYKITSSSRSESYPPFADNDYSWGITPNFLNTGCDVVNYKGPVIEAENGKGIIVIQVPSNDIFPHLVRFCTNTDLDTNLEKWMCAERTGCYVSVHFTCPSPGEYVFSFWVKTVENEDSFDTSISFLILSSEGGLPEDAYPPFGSIWGLQEPAVSLGIQVLNLKSSTIETTDGCCLISVLVPRGIKISHRLEIADCKNWRQFIYAETDGDRVHYHIQIPVAGRFLFHIDGANSNDAPHELAAIFLIENKKCYKGCLYPTHENCTWGPRDALSEHGLTISKCTSSTIQVSNGKAHLYIQLPEINFPLAAMITHADSPEEVLGNCSALYREGEDARDITVSVRLEKIGYYCLRLIESTTGSSLATYILYLDNPATNIKYYFESYDGIYGPTEAFSQHELVSSNPAVSYFQTDNNCKCQISLRIPHSVEILLFVYKDNQEEKGHLLPERQGQKTLIHFKGRQQGFYQIRIYANSNANKHVLVFVYLIENIVDCNKWEAYPDCQSVWGLTQEAASYDIEIDSSEESQSVLRTEKGFTSITLTHPANVRLKARINLTDTVSAERAKRCVLIEPQNNKSLIRVTVPAEGYFVLMVGATRERSLSSKTVAFFLIESLADIGQHYGFPSFSNFSDGCCLTEPLVNPLGQNTDYSFKIRVPGAIDVRLWDKDSAWRADLCPSEDEVFAGVVNVAGVKDVWVTARFPKGNPQGEGGSYRNLLLYEVR